MSNTCQKADVVVAAEEPRYTINLNGIWDFEQSEKAFVPQEFTRKAPVPGLISQAEPKIEGYETLFSRPDKVEHSTQYNLLESKRKLRYNWYRRKVFVPKELEGTCAVLTLLKSQYVTNVLVNGIDAGTSIACFTPIEFPVTNAVRFGQDNEILVRVGARAFLPSEAAGGTDKERANYIPGIWDDMYLSFTGKLRIWRALLLPKVSEKKVTVKLLVRSFFPPQTTYDGLKEDLCEVRVDIREKGGRAVSAGQHQFKARRDNMTEVALDVPMANDHLWTPDDPFLYTAEISLYNEDKASDTVKVNFGMRDFGRKGRRFTLNGKPIFLRGTNITLHRFFEDPDCNNLPWDRQWVEKLLSDIPKQLDWNAMRISVGIAPKFWYDIADQSGLLLQNEWMYWQNHGWDEQIRTEYTDWVWADGSHPSIAIWDAINENRDPFIGNTLIPQLKKLDDTRIWDAGYMTSDDMALDEMDEPHIYMAMAWGDGPKFGDDMVKNPYSLGDLDYRSGSMQPFLNSGSPQLVNEYGWNWLWRDGQPAKLTVPNYKFYLGKNATAQQRRNLQAYWLALETEWLRSERSFAGVLAFCYLTNNYGFTGDWFIDDIKDLRPGPTLEWFRHCFAPAAVFIDLTDERYTKHVPPHEEGSELVFNLVGVNDEPNNVNGQVKVKLLDAGGKQVAGNDAQISIPAYGKCYLPTKLQLPRENGGYLLLAEFKPVGIDTNLPIISRRYIKVGEKDTYAYFEYEPKPLKY